MSVRRRLLTQAAGGFALNLVSVGLAMGTAIVLTRMLSVEGYGVVAFAVATITLLRVPAVLGTERLIIRHLAVYESRSAYGLARGLLRRSRQAALLTSITLAATAGGVAWLVSGRIATTSVLALWIGLVSLPLIAIGRVTQAATVGLHHVVTAQIPELLIRPAIFVGLVVGAWMVVGASLAPSSVLVLHVLAVAISVAVATHLLRSRTPTEIKTVEATFNTRAWLGSALSLVFLGEAAVINAQIGTVLLGAMKGPEEAGLFSVAIRAANLITFAQIAVNAALGPAAAKLWESAEIDRLQRTVTTASRVVLAIALPTALAFIFFGRPFLSFLFGAEFVAAGVALAILSVGQLANAATGAVATLLVMTGHERRAATGVGIAAAGNVVLSVFLIQVLGIEGAALGTALSMVLWNLLLARAAHQLVGVQSTALGRIRLTLWR